MRTDLRQVGTEGEDRRGKDHLFLTNAADPQHVKAVLNRLESDAAFLAMSLNRVEARLVDACEAFRPTDRTWMHEMRAVQNTCATHRRRQVPMLNELSERSQKVEQRSRLSRLWFEFIGGTCMQSDARHGAALCVADITPPCGPGRAKQNEVSRRHNGHVPKFTKMNHFTDGEWSLRLRRDAVMVPGGNWRGTLARVCKCRIAGGAQRINAGAKSR